MSTQLRLVEAPAERPSRRRGPRRARTVRSPRARQARWDAEWRLDAKSRRVGREGVAAARASLVRAGRPDAPLSKAS